MSNKMEFKLEEKREFIQLNQLLQVIGVAQTGGHAKILIKENEIKVNSIIETQIRKKLKKQDVVSFGDTEIEIC